MGKDSFVHTNEGNFVLLLAYKYLVYTGVSTEQEEDACSFKLRASNSWLVNLITVMESQAGAATQNTSPHGKE